MRFSKEEVNMRNEIRKKRKKKIQWGQIALHIFYILSCLTYILPVWLLISISLSGKVVLKYSFIPETISTFAYEMAFRDPEQILRAYAVTFFYSIVGVVLSLAVMSLFGFALSRKNFKLKKFFSRFVLINMLFGGGMIPTYIIITKFLHLNDTIWVYIIPSLVSAWTVVLIKTYFMNLPEEIFESARMDGASETRLCFQIAIPMSVPILVTQAYGKFLAGWNDWICSSMYVRKQELFSLQYLLKLFMDKSDMSTQLMGGSGMSTADLIAATESIRYAMAIIGIGPAFIIFPLIQKYYEKGLIVGSLKG